MSLSVDICSVFEDPSTSFTTNEIMRLVCMEGHKSELTTELSLLVDRSILERKHSRYSRGKNFSAVGKSTAAVNSVRQALSEVESQDPKPVKAKSKASISKSLSDHKGVVDSLKIIALAMSPVEVGEDYSPQVKLDAIEALENMISGSELAVLLNEVWNDLNAFYEKNAAAEKVSKTKKAS